MPKKINWTHIQCYNSKILLDNYIASCISTSISRSQHHNCTECEVNVEKHQMKYTLSKCSSDKCNSQALCKFTYKTLCKTFPRYAKRS